MNLNSFAKKVFIAWMALFFIASPLLGARVAYAQGTTVGDLPRVLASIKDGLTDFIKNTMQAAIVTALINTMSFAADRLAYDAAVRIATGGPAEEPLFDGTPEGTYLGNLAADMAGEAIGSLSETIEGAGGVLSNFDLCAPSTPYIMLQFKLGIKGVFDRPEPKCDFNKMFGPEGTWAAFTADLAGYTDPFKNQLILAELANMYDPQKAEFGAGLGLYTDIFGETVFLPLLQTEKKLQNNGFKDVVDFITGNIETPADILQKQVEDAQEESGDVRQQATFAMLGNKDLLLQIGVHAGSVFTNTLLSKIQEQIWAGMFDFDITQVDPFDPNSFALNTTEDVAEHYRSLLTASPLQISNYSILSEFITCPGSDARGLYNCVADTNFVSAIARADAGAPMTIAEAVKEGMLDGSWPLISSGDVARNQDAFCYSYGFCYGNLVKLRKARVISLGWELAANAPQNSVENPVTLQEVMDGFNSCGADGLPDDNHPWCKMIDPDWVLKYPDTQCRMQAYGEVLLTDEADERGQVCVDMPSCIAEDENGNCVGGYGYCVAEENSWRFRGESCPDYAASCLVFEDSQGDTSALLRNTVDPGPCTADNVGCRWYATEKEKQSDGTYAFAAIANMADADASGETYASRIYVNNQVEECDESDGGCATLIERGTDLRLNTVYNSSFEIDEDSDDAPDGWYDYHLGTLSWPSEISSDGTYARDGEIAVSPGQASSGLGALYQPGIALGQARTYTLSFYARQRGEGDTDTINALLNLTDETGTAVDIAGLAISGDCNDTYTNILGATVSTGVGIEAVQPESTSYERFSCTFTVPPLSDSSLRVYGSLFFLNFDGYIDNIQLEQGEDASSPVEGYSSNAYATVVAKVAPAYLGCTGASSDPAECENYAQVCSEQDVGCALYAPINGDPSISGIATELDACPAECSGYDTYRQEATRYEPDGVDVVYFIPDTATECSAESVGCDEFTNLATEEREYYTFLRACVTEDQALANIASDNQATFYTWEGSDENGYQLRTWSLLESNLGSTDYTHKDNADGTGGVIDTTPDQAPCSTWNATENGISCNDSTDDDGDGYYDWDTENCNERADIFTNADCREFYDAAGNIHYREWQNTVTVNNACESYRKTTIAGNDAGERQATCEDSGGYYASASGDCIYYGHREESAVCDESANGCREYAGGRSRNSRLVLEEIFEDGTLNNWDAASAAHATYSNESLAADGHSMLITASVTTFSADNGSVCTTEGGCSGSSRSFGGECTIAKGAQYCGTLENELFPGKTYTVSVVAKGTGTVQVGFDFNANSGAPAIDVPFDDAVELEDGWQQFTFGPLIMDADEYPLFGEGTALVITPTGNAYIDNVVLREGEEGLTVIRDSWITPASCDQSITGAASPQYFLGCQEYTDQDAETVYLKSLSALCDEDKVGCDAFFKTQESEKVTAETRNATCTNVDADINGSPDVAVSATACYYFTRGLAAFDTDSQYLCTISAGRTSCLFSQSGFTPNDMLPSHISYGPETVITPADADMFLVVTNEVTCDNDVAGCTEFGDPSWNQDRNSTSGAESTYFLNLPDTYSETLCTHEELFCDAFTTNTAETFYFKHPLEQTCEYKTNVTVNGVVYNGWFRSGTTDFCYGTCEDRGGNEGGACGSDADCAKGGTCNAENPSYVIGGTESGLWNSGDEAYTGWAGECSAAYNTCTEFQDKLAQDDGELYGETDGTSYFYLNNDTLSEYGLSDSQKCNGQVSLKNGCALFYDTGDTSLSANASATEVASRNADTLFGSEPYGLVDPIDCENGGDTTITLSSGEEVDLCASRCTYDYGEVYDLTDGKTYEEKLTEELTGSANYSRDEMYVFGGSCYSTSDCASVQGESGIMVEAMACATQVRTAPYSFGSSLGGGLSAWSSREIQLGFSEAPRQENDTNTVLKVNRDRECAEWLACSDKVTTWDESTASFITTCNDIALCTGYDASTGTTACSDWNFTKPDVIFNATWYASRDTSWYGNEYSGMAIPNTFPVQALTQADVSLELYCVNTVSNTLGIGTCEEEGTTCAGAGSATRCMTYEDAVDVGALGESDGYALVLNAGSCTEDYGASCAVGYCEETGAACATTDQCASGACLVGACYNIDEDTDDVDGDGNTIEAVLCQNIQDCQEGQTCYSGVCADIGTDVAIEDYDAETGEASSCSAAEIFVHSAKLKLGSCINDACLLTPNGDAYEDGQTEGKICRAYPENNSPFPNSIVEAWYDTAEAGSITDELSANVLPYDMRSGFENVVTCTYGEDCDCSYNKVTYGEGMETRYYAVDWNAEFSICTGDLETYEDAGDVCSSSSSSRCSSGSCESVTGKLGVCQSGERTGGYCTENEQCGENNTCTKTTREDVMYGMNGFCLEHDTSMNILGDRNKQACISWLPVDQLAGDTDLNAKYIGAGYFEDTYVCADTRLLVNLKTSFIPELKDEYSEGDIACAESNEADISGVTYEDAYSSDIAGTCAENAYCPEGYWTLIGMPTWKDDTVPNAMARACSFEGTSGNDCPYVCVPFGAENDAGESCNPEDDDSIPQLFLDDHEVIFGFDVSMEETQFFIGGEPLDKHDAEPLQYFNDLANELRTCTSSAVEYSDALFVDDGAPLELDDPSDIFNYEHLKLQVEPFAGCKEIVQVASALEGISYAWTDRILGESQGYFAIEDSEETMRFTYETTPGPYGFFNSSPRTANNALAVATCLEASGLDLLLREPNDTVNSLNGCLAGAGSGDVTAGDPEDPEARAFLPFSINVEEVENGEATDLVTDLPHEGVVSNWKPGVMDRITQVFASINLGIENALSRWTGTWWDANADTDFTYETDTIEGEYDSAEFDVRASEGNPPKIWGVNVDSCSDDGTLCEEGSENAFTINSKESGNHSGEQFFSATIKFYAAADKNQLPIRRIIVDWGDDIDGGDYSGSDADDNFYKNARGLQNGTQNSKCELGDEWGLTDASCDPYYYTFNHIYTCSSEILTNSSAACVGDGSTGDAGGNFPCNIDQSGDGIADSCVFQPRVHVRDNWGFCTGTCTTGTDGTTSCFDGGSIKSNDVTLVDECIYTFEDINYSPYVEYSGVIIVTP